MIDKNELFERMNKDDQAIVMNLMLKFTQDSEPEPKDDIHFQPEEGVRYWIIDDTVEASLSTNEGDCDFLSKDLILYGNCFRTREEALARVKLRKHVVKMNLKYGEHEGVSMFLTYELEWCGTQHRTIHDSDTLIAMLYDNPDAMHIASTEEERVERLRLIKAVYGGE